MPTINDDSVRSMNEHYRIILHRKITERDAFLLVL
jgi:UV DNA damage repair endonuclease